MTIRNANLHHNVDYTPFEGMTVTGWPDIVLSRGDIVCAEGELLAAQGRGHFLECGRPEPVASALASVNGKTPPWISE